MIGPIQVDILKRLHDSLDGVPINELLKEFRYKQGGKRSLASLEKAGYIRTTKGVAQFVRYPDEIEQRVTMKTYSMDQLQELDDLSRRNLLYLYQAELSRYKDGVVPGNALPHGVRRSLQHLGVIKWKILELTDLGRKLLGEIMSRTTPSIAQTSIGY